MKTIRELISFCVLVAFLPIGVMAQDLPKPERIYEGARSQTKTYMHQFVDSPDGTKYAFRYFPGDDQPTGRTGSAVPCEVWVCNSDITGHFKAFTSPKGEGGHGSDVIVWVTNDLIYYCGILYQISTNKVLWQFDDTDLPLARSGIVNENKLYVGIRSRNSKKKGWYWLNPTSPTKPQLHLISDMKDLVKYYGGEWENSEATYIYQNPSDTKLFVVVYDRQKRQEYAFVLNVDGSVHSYLGSNAVGHCHNGHVLWVDDKTLMAGNQHPGLFDLNGKLIKRLAPKGNHLSLSPDKKWWVTDVYKNSEVRLHRFGSTEYNVISGNVEYFSDYHPSFSRDGKYVFFQGKRPSETHMGVYRVDVSGITGARQQTPAYFGKVDPKQGETSKYFSNWPEGKSPAEIGKKVSENFLPQGHYQTISKGKHRKFVSVVYPEVCLWFGALKVARETGDNELAERLVRRFDPYLEDTKQFPFRFHVDHSVNGVIPLEIYRLTQDKRYLDFGMNRAKHQWSKTTPDGITAQARYWVDDIYMIAAIQTAAYRVTGDTKYLDRAALTTATYLKKLQKDDGLFWHSEDSPFVWGRGNGWYAAGMTEILKHLAPENPHYAPIMTGYKKMMAALLQHQSKSGLWRQLVDKPDAWEETSGTGMFTYAMVTGVKHGWLNEKTYGPAARKAWLGLVDYLDEKGNMKNVCVGTNKAFKEVGSDMDTQYEYYLARPRYLGDYHGQAALLWTAAALLEKP